MLKNRKIISVLLCLTKKRRMKVELILIKEFGLIETIIIIIVGLFLMFGLNEIGQYIITNKLFYFSEYSLGLYTAFLLMIMLRVLIYFNFEKPSKTEKILLRMDELLTTDEKKLAGLIN